MTPRDRIRLQLGLAGLTVGCLAGAPALGQGHDVPDASTTLFYDAPAECPSATDFVQAVRGRLRRGQVVLTGPADARLHITIVQEDNRSSATLDTADAPGGDESRNLSAPTCQEAVDAVALLAALAVDARVDEPAADRGRATPSALAIADSGPVNSPAEPESKPISWVIGARFRVDTPKAPQILLGGEIFGEVVGRGGEWSSSLALGAATTGRRETGPGETRFSWFGARLSGCFPYLPSRADLRVAPCAFVEAGLTRAEGFIDEPSAVVDPWFSVGAAAVLTVPLGPFVLDAQAGPLFPIRHRDRYVFVLADGREHPIFDVPWFGVLAALGVGLSIE